MAKTVLCFGDSNTHGTRAMQVIGERGRFDKDVRWTGVMAANLPGGDFTIIEEGLPGRTTVFDDPIEGAHKNGMRTLRAVLESHREIDLVIIMLGTNDLKHRFSATASDIATGAEKLVIEARNALVGPDGTASQILLVAPVPVAEVGVLADMFLGGAEKSRALGAKMAVVAERQQTGFLDLADVAQVDMTDGIHLDADAHAAIGAAMAKAVLRTLP
ncbi:MAG: SGNH/GDSL hydrolase family protein [Rhizobiaceae bacterium]|nr:SGNH/GDSL hydrolase family protein [Hyphomicrobiales bacterium]NRB30868.1 SGNH/GDSL hydrolase family protein [Rhizobiaceae bacterium]